jgi:hypothetical protein
VVAGVKMFEKGLSIAEGFEIQNKNTIFAALLAIRLK